MTRLIVVAVLVACGGRSSTPGRPPHAGAGGSAASTDRRDDEACHAVIGHALSLALADRPADQKLTADERTAIEDQLRTRWLPSCKQMTASGYDCAVAAHSLAELDACARTP